MNKIKIVIALSTVLVTHYATASGTDSKIDRLVVGDSIAHGIRTVNNIEGNSRVGATVEVLQQMMSTVPYNKDKEYNPYVFISIGTNDYWKGYSTEQYNHELVKLEAIITHRIKPTKITYLIPCNTRVDIERGTRSVIEALKMARDYRLLPCHSKTADTIHYTAYGYKSIEPLLSTDTVSYTNSGYGWTNNKRLGL